MFSAIRPSNWSLNSWSVSTVLKQGLHDSLKQLVKVTSQAFSPNASISSQVKVPLDSVLNLLMQLKLFILFSLLS